VPWLPQVYAYGHEAALVNKPIRHIVCAGALSLDKPNLELCH